MAAPEPAALVDLEGHARGGVGERGEERIDAPAVADQGGPRARPALVHGPGEAAVLGQRAARHHGADGVQQHETRGLPPRVRHALKARVGDEAGEPVEVVHVRGGRYPAVPAIGATGPVLARNWPQPGFCSSRP